ncbi:hypothetical protein B488_07810 [Liberibacter crescens BT-1]|uniref:Uncharacterized protein n=1 Tax=Liberibacter crescens (strain BT-1) TaxID=1215343 RepID=L0EVS4_LIBCB|nr:hypothetical protein [Liberibacter crescens]AGA64773.1 hypothetical protein B488_07810 [Liberibacter crescens BT-1]
MDHKGSSATPKRFFFVPSRDITHDDADRVIKNDDCPSSWFTGNADENTPSAQDCDDEMPEKTRLQESLQQQGEEQETAEEDDHVSVSLGDGQDVSIAELKEVYRSYQENRNEIGEQKKQLRQQAEMLSKSAEALAKLIDSHIPAVPDAHLAMSDPGACQQALALRQQALAVIDHFMEAAKIPHTVADTLHQEASQKVLEHENLRLESLFPQTKDPVQREVFFKEAFDAGRQLGFSEQEMQEIVDHRLLALAHYARVGLQARQAVSKAYQKTRGCPPVTAPVQGRGTNHQVSDQKKALQRLNKSGSLRDALALDFE